MQCSFRSRVSCVAGLMVGAAFLLPMPKLGSSAANAQDVAPAEKPAVPGVPDYTRITGFHDKARLPLVEPQVLWLAKPEVADAAGRVKTSSLSDSVFAEGVLYFGIGTGQVMALNSNNGETIWTHEHGSRVGVTPSVDQEHVYFGATDGITALRRDTGEVVWQHVIARGAGECTPIPVGKRVFVSGYDGCSYCLDRDTGREIWKHDFASDAPPDQPDFAGAKARFQEIVARPNGAACDGKMFIQCIFDQSRVIALDCETGERQWAFQTGGWISPAPTIAGDRVYITSQDKHLYCLKQKTGELDWKFQAPNWLASRVAVHEGRVYLPNHGGKLFQLDAATGAVNWMFEPADEADRAGLVYSFPIIANGAAYFTAGSTGLLFAVDIETGKLRWRLQPSEKSELFTNPVTDGRRIFVTSRTSNDKAGENALIAIGDEP